MTRLCNHAHVFNDACTHTLYHAFCIALRCIALCICAIDCVAFYWYNTCSTVQTHCCVECCVVFHFIQIHEIVLYSTHVHVFNGAYTLLLLIHPEIHPSIQSNPIQSTCSTTVYIHLKCCFDAHCIDSLVFIELYGHPPSP